jgi:hypothetical protein
MKTGSTRNQALLFSVLFIAFVLQVGSYSMSRPFS